MYHRPVNLKFDVLNLGNFERQIGTPTLRRVPHIPSDPEWQFTPLRMLHHDLFDHRVDVV